MHSLIFGAGESISHHPIHILAGLNLEHAKAAFMKRYGPGSEIFEAARIREETGDKSRPIKGPWTNHPVKEFVKAVMANASSTGGWCMLCAQLVGKYVITVDPHLSALNGTSLCSGT